MGADSLASNADLRVDSSTPKVYRFNKFLLGFAGSYAAGQIMRSLMSQEPDLTLKQVSEYQPQGNDWEILLADFRGVYEMSPGGGLVKMSTRQSHSYGAIGAGAGVALGSLYSWHDGQLALVSALRAAEAHTNHVRRPFKVISL
jgi:hypothetical protein